MIKTTPHRPGGAGTYNPDKPLLCQRHIAYDLCQLVFDLIGAPESARRFRGPAGHFAAISKTLEERPNPAVGHYLDNQENLAKIERYFSTFEIAETLAEGNVVWRDRLTQAFQDMGPVLDTLLEEALNRQAKQMLDMRWGAFIKQLRAVIERYLRDTPGPPPKKDSGGSEKQSTDTKQPENETSTPPSTQGKKKIAKRIKSEDEQRQEETDSSLKGENDESTIPEEHAVPANVEPVVTAKARVDGSVFSDVNQTARVGANVEQPTLIADRVTAKSLKSGKELPNGNMGTAHAEIGAIQQAFEAGATKGADMTLTVTGKAVCGFCRGDIAAMANKSGLKSLTVFEEATGNTLYWQPGMKSLKKVK